MDPLTAHNCFKTPITYRRDGNDYRWVAEFGNQTLTLDRRRSDADTPGGWFYTGPGQRGRPDGPDGPWVTAAECAAVAYIRFSNWIRARSADPIPDRVDS